ncbi:MAG: response regulator [Rhodospirillaceae bacterium]
MAQRISPGPGLPSRPSILVADGIPTNRLVVRSLLEKAGCRVDLAATGPDALTALRSFAHDLVVLDLALPGLDALTVIRRLRSSPGFGRRVPVLAISASPTGADRRDCLAAGANACLTRPFRCSDLKTVVARLLAGEECDGDGDGNGAPAEPTTDDGGDIEPVLDSHVLARLGGDLGAETLNGVLVTFSRDMGIRLHRIADAAASANLRALVFESHAVSSCCLPLGARRLAQLCGTLESAALNGDRDQALSLAWAIGSVGADTLSALSGHAGTA